MSIIRVSFWNTGLSPEVFYINQSIFIAKTHETEKVSQIQRGLYY